MKTKVLVEQGFLEDKEIETLAREQAVKIMRCDPDGVLIGIKHWESCVFSAFNETLYKLAPMIMNTPEFREEMILQLKGQSGEGTFVRRSG